jgi:heptose-I-phosphate ethanolaminephosphotransferase
VKADKTVFTNQNRTVKRIYDGELIPHFEKSLTDGANKQLIVLHLYGSHLSYKQRYPQSFHVFKDQPQGYKGRPKGLIDRINAYSNSILYTDTIVSQVIGIAAKKELPSCVVYTSDHGEYLADNAKDDFTGHGYPLPYKVEVEVPLMVWCNNLYRQKYPQKWQAIKSNLHAKITTEDLFFSMADLMNISFDDNNTKRSFFNKAYTPLKIRKVRTAADNKLYNYFDLP